MKSSIKSRKALIFLLAFALSCGAGAKDAAGLAKDVKHALDKKDVTALLATADLKQAPARVMFTLMTLPDDCAAPMNCTVALQTVDETWQKRTEQDMLNEKLEWRNKPEGLLLIKGQPNASAPASPGEGMRSLEVKLPYARVDGEHKVVSARYTAARTVELQATTAHALADVKLAEGIQVAGMGAPEKGWKAKATALPPGGGAAGAAYLATINKRAAAQKDRDLDTFVAATGLWGSTVFGAKDFAGRDVPRELRLRTMNRQWVRMTATATVLGGYQSGDLALLIVEGGNGAGNVLRGTVLMEREKDAWVEAEGGADLIEIPKRE